MAKWAVLNGPARSTARLIVSGRARQPCRAWAAVSARSAGPARHDFFYFIKHSVYIYIYIDFIFAIYNKCTRVPLVSLGFKIPLHTVFFYNFSD
jgi:hypothetical protein